MDRCRCRQGLQLARADPPDQRHRRRPLRLEGYDYSQTGVYFVTVAVQGRSCLLGGVIGEDMHLNAAGEMACRVWQALPERFPNIDLDAFVVMPNHIHGIIGIGIRVGAPLVGARSPIQQDQDRAATRAAPTSGGATLDDVAAAAVGAPLVGAQPPIHQDSDRAATRAAPTGGRVALGDVVGAYKSLVTVEYIRGVKELGWPPFDRRLWQRRYYEHVVRNENSLNHLREYVQDNPARWALDRENPLAQRPEDP